MHHTCVVGNIHKPEHMEGLATDLKDIGTEAKTGWRSLISVTASIAAK